MIGDSALIEKLTNHFKESHPTKATLAACCKDISETFKFDCVFVAHSNSPEAVLEPLAFDGKEEVMDGCLYRLGVEERVALTKIILKNYSDITGKPIFNRAGSLRIQKPSSGLFFAIYKVRQDYLLLGCAHQDSQAYNQELLSELTNLWRSWQEDLLAGIHLIMRPAKIEAPPPVSSHPPASPANLSDIESNPFSPPRVDAPKSADADKDGKHLRPVVLVDEVTRLFNRDYFEECLAIEVERAKRYSRHVSLLFLSVTPIDPVAAKANENAIATQIAEILFKSLRRVDIICRLEKNKYGIILPDTDNNTYGIIAKRVFKFFKLVMGDTQPVFLNISASTYPKHAGNHILLFENTDKLLKQAQEVGPNKAVLPE